jgi:hypothetical protein
VIDSSFSPSALRTVSVGFFIHKLFMSPLVAHDVDPDAVPNAD